MEMSPQINELAKALAAAQRKIQAAKKDSQNPHFRSRYADLASCWDACREQLTSNGISVIQPVQKNHEGPYLQTILLHESGQWIASGEYPLRSAKDDSQGLGSAITYGRRYSLCAMVGVAPDDDDDGEAAQGRPQAKSVPQARPPFQQTAPRMNEPVAVQPPKAADPMPAAVNDAPPKYAYGNGNATKGISEAQVKRLYALKHKAGWHDQELKQYMQAEFKVASTNALNREQYDKICGLLESRTPFVEAFMAHDVPPPSEEPSTDRGGAYDPTLDEIPF